MKIGQSLLVGFLICAGAAQADPIRPADLYQEQYRPQFHFTPQQKWMNDPNGMVYYQGEYHLFYQYHPYSNVWGPMHWGHAISKDLVTWEHQPVALYPDRNGTIFSGSAVVDVNNTSGFGTEDNPPMVAIFTYHDHLKHDFGRNDFQSQGIAYSLDSGRTWTKYSDNPVLKNQGERDFRDPKVFWYAPGEKWIMTLAVQNRVSFYSSKNLKEWTFESDFGAEWGSHEGVWECPELIKMPIEGTDESKYILLVSVISGAPNGGTGTQYLVGDFDGATFTVDPKLKNLKTVPAVFPDGQLFDDFESSINHWISDADLVYKRPVAHSLLDESIHGQSVLSTGAKGDASTGSLYSKEFTINHPFINFYVGGGANQDQLGMHLLVDGHVVRRATGRDSEVMRAVSWDVTEFLGQQAQLEIVDQAVGRWGQTLIDNIVFAQKPVKSHQQAALWLDWGADNYAGVTWSNIPEEDGRRLFIGWMSNWDYATSTPTERWRSAMTLPRSLSLHETESGFRLHSKPVQELKQLREKKLSKANTTFSGQIDLVKDIDTNQGTMEIVLSLDALQAQEVTLALANTENEQTFFTIDLGEGVYKLDRTLSGRVDFSSSFASVQIAPISGNHSDISLQLFVDHSSVEIFINDGETVLTSQVFPTQPYTDLSLSSDDLARINSAEVYILNSIWRDK